MVRLASNGKYWQAVWDNGTRRCVKSLGPKSELSRREAMKRCADLFARHVIDPSTANVGTSPTLSAWLMQYAALRTDLNEPTVKLYAETSVYLLRYFNADPKMERIGRIHASQFRVWLGQQPNGRGGKLHENTVRHHLGRCGVIFDWAKDRDLCPRNPFDREKTSYIKTDTETRFVTLGELDRLLASCPGPEWRALLGLCRLAGLRRGEAVRLAWSCIDWERHTLLVLTQRGRETTKQKKRTVPIVPALYEILRAAFEAAAPGAELVCPVVNIENVLGRVAKLAGLTLWASPIHTLRKNCESEWLAAHPVMDVCRWLGHNPKVAAAHYHQTTTGTMDRVTGRAAEQPQNQPQTASQ